ncbi:MAG TPA: NADPH:quinone oxidoreductase family protein [Motilibacteraceae bacterium]|nr:NADPH:quinone oxidoreductase family protein [Motilibacteraceae bacterium]
MRAWQVHENGDPADVLRLEEAPDPTPGPGQLLVRVESAALNFPDVLLCQGKYQEKPPLPFTPGVELHGEVVAVGDGVTRSAPGDAVIGTPGLPRGAYAELAVVDEGQAWPALPALSSAQNAGLFLTYQTGHVALHRRANLQPGEVLLVHGGAGGVGTAAIQLGKAAGATVIATAGGPEKVEVCRRMGADVAIDYRADDFVPVVKEVTGGRGADVVYDPVGGDVFERSLKCIAFEGRVLVIGFTQGRFGQAPTNHALVKNYSVVGVHWGLYRKMDPSIIEAAQRDLEQLADKGLISPYVSEEVGMADLPAALTRLGSRGTTGKVVVHPHA